MIKDRHSHVTSSYKSKTKVAKKGLINSRAYFFKKISVPGVRDGNS